MFAESVILRQTEQASWNLESVEHKQKPSHKLQTTGGQDQGGKEQAFSCSLEKRKKGRKDRNKTGREVATVCA